MNIPHADIFQQVDDLLYESIYEKAVALTRPLAEAGVAWAQGSLGSCYQCGCGVPLDLDLATHWLTLAASQDEGLSCHNLSTLYAVQGDSLDQSEYWRAQAHRLGWDLLTQPWPNGPLQGDPIAPVATK